MLRNDNSRMHRIIMLNLAHNTTCFRCQTNGKKNLLAPSVKSEVSEGVPEWSAYK